MASLDGLDWSVVDFSSNPVPGDPDKAEELADHYGTRSESFHVMSDSLKKIRNNSAGLRGRWVERFDRDFGDMPEDFGDFSVSCSTVETQVRAWALDMRRCQDTARLAYERAKDARDRRARFQLQCDEQWGQCVSCNRELSGLSASDGSSSRRVEVERQRDAAKELLSSYENKLADADSDYEQARKTIKRVKGEYDDAASRHAAAIRAIDCTPKSITNSAERFYYSDGWQWVMAGVKVASFAAGVASFFVGGWFVAAVGAAAAAAQLVITGFKVWEKDATRADLAFDAVSAALAFLPFLTLSRKLSGFLGKTFDEAVSSARPFCGKSPLKTIQKNMNEMLYRHSADAAPALRVKLPKHAVNDMESLNGWKETLGRIRTSEKLSVRFAAQFTDAGKAWTTVLKYKKSNYDWIESGLKLVSYTKPAVKCGENWIDSVSVGQKLNGTGDMVFQYLFPGYSKIVKPVEGIGKVVGNAW